jgi:hypothetical protein
VRPPFASVAGLYFYLVKLETRNPALHDDDLELPSDSLQS